uniref:Uncharacterized protein n=1 Tax=Bombyx mori TaxID=7091 RepID=A0A8R2M9E6_BOMMO|nr:uncharacterized protein LOC110386639 [Bombyx mori]XP_037875750.1 uncharacterized protein LOC110386639 [Bombyx mori]XP_037875751.1 uncharacterized protein LOC110386639 [Bombyx mori]
MSQQLRDLHANLEYLREYIVKLGPNRRTEDLGFKKLEEAQKEYSKLECILTHLNQEIQDQKLDKKSCEIFQTLIDEIRHNFKKIKSLFSLRDSSSQTSSKDLIEYSDCTTKMSDSFDIKTAISLLPVMNGQEQVTNQLIDGILLYSSLINDDSKSKLIDFVLKTRLSPSAKLRLKAKYTDIESLVGDIRVYLLPKKSAVALQTQLFRVTQGRRTIEKFGSEIEELFVNLTIAQANEKRDAYEVLRPLNEKTAIKRFSDGLADRRLSTIIASRQFASLSEAITAAVDEQSMSFHPQEQVMQFRANQNVRRGGNYRGFRGRGDSHFYNNKTNYNRNYNCYENSTGQRTSHIVNRGKHSGDQRRRQHFRGRPMHYQRVQHNTQESNVQDNLRNDNTNNYDNLEFFRT